MKRYVNELECNEHWRVEGSESVAMVWIYEESGSAAHGYKGVDGI